MTETSRSCRVAVENTDENCCAHVLFAGRFDVQPGDIIQVLGEEIQAKPGDRFTLRREATHKRANWFQRQWTKFTAIFEITELYEVSFSGRRKL